MGEKVENLIRISDRITVGYLGEDKETGELTPESFRVLLTFADHPERLGEERHDDTYILNSYEAQAVARYLNSAASEAQMAERGWKAENI